jgi:glycosyltransferase involved in cell wall biosynthesis
MNAIDTLVLPSLVEGFPCVILEAMSCGIPVICSNLPCHIELLEKVECGFTFDVEKVQALINCLSALSKKPSLRRRLGVNGRCYIENYHSINKVITEYNEAMLTSIKTRYAKGIYYKKPAA